MERLLIGADDLYLALGIQAIIETNLRTDEAAGGEPADLVVSPTPRSRESIPGGPRRRSSRRTTSTAASRSRARSHELRALASWLQGHDEARAPVLGNRRFSPNRRPHGRRQLRDDGQPETRSDLTIGPPVGLVEAVEDSR